MLARLCVICFRLPVLDDRGWCASCIQEEVDDFAEDYWSDYEEDDYEPADLDCCQLERQNRAEDRHDELHAAGLCKGSVFCM